MSASEIWLVDVSSSMTGERYRRMTEALRALHAGSPHVKLIAFSTGVEEVASPDRLPQPSGGTALHLGLDVAMQHFPGKVVVWSDGCPNDTDAALASAANLPGIVDTLFFGDEGDAQAKQFMEKLARNNGGRWVFKDILKNQSLLCQEVRELLGLPAPIAL